MTALNLFEICFGQCFKNACPQEIHDTIYQLFGDCLPDQILSTRYNDFKPILPYLKEIPKRRCILYNFYHPRCPYSVKLLPVWTELVKKIENSHDIDINIVLIDVAMPENEPVANYYHIDCYPTIMLSTPRISFEYSGARSVDNLYDFIQNRIIGYKLINIK